MIKVGSYIKMKDYLNIHEWYHSDPMKVLKIIYSKISNVYLVDYNFSGGTSEIADISVVDITQEIRLLKLKNICINE